MIYADTNILVYLVEDATERGDAIRRRFSQISDEVAVSPLVEMECSVVPLRTGDNLLLRRYRRLIDDLFSLEIGPEVYREAAALRARHGIATVDALHLATAQHHLCDAFWTNDARLARAAGGLRVETV
ncbi:type II toxin-antitoxin system VapC family toxin [Herbiconiux liangxiaofengii]|uniref:type II toxin-antitoxin system VapC family toxin n=1 Tax=Herbiconiux liangxiaofengii TaxID=3342795 RepID=UPI0035BB5B18